MKPSRLSRWIARVLFNYAGKRPCRLIGRYGKPYLERYFLFQKFGITAYLHRFVRDDAEEELHNHPWRLATSLVLCGEYREQRLHAFCQRMASQPDIHLQQVRWINVLTPDSWHCITSVRPETWTLFMHTGWRFGWGFLRPAWSLNATTLTFHPVASRASTWWKNAPAGIFTRRQPLAHKGKR